MVGIDRDMKPRKFGPFLSWILLLTCLLNFCGCAVVSNSATSEVLAAARPPDNDVEKEPVGEVNPTHHEGESQQKDAKRGHPACYLLLPITVPFDIATFPLQALLYYGLFKGMCA